MHIALLSKLGIRRTIQNIIIIITSLNRGRLEGSMNSMSNKQAVKSPFYYNTFKSQLRSKKDFPYSIVLQIVTAFLQT